MRQAEAGDRSHAAEARADAILANGQSRTVIEAVSPRVDDGRFAVKRSVGEAVRVEADIFTDGHDKVSAVVQHRVAGSGRWNEIAMAPLVNDRWYAEFGVHAVGRHEFRVVAWVDHFATWRYDFQKRVNAGQDVGVDLKVGAQLIDEAASAAEGEVARSLGEFARFLRSDSRGEAIELALGESIHVLMNQYGVRPFKSESATTSIWVDRWKARFSTWYELFPRSASPDPGRRGNFNDVEARLPSIADMGFDVLYLPPIHPIGRAFRKGKNNTPVAMPGDVGSPWAIGGPEGGHDAIHPELGTLEDFRSLVEAAETQGIEIAMDLAFQCSPDHPYVKEHPQWFKHRPDGTIQYAENPPKKYQDIYPFDFECEDYESLWSELLRVTLYWVSNGIRIFRVDNPHTKPFAFWEWLIAQVKAQHPDVLFLAEAFTRPKVMYRLGKIGFSQSYSYFTWRNEPWEIKQYYTELFKTNVIDFFRPNAWPNTPDILPTYLQTDARAAHMVRAILAATLCANYGIYGPAFELMVNKPVAPGKEEYLHSEKYEAYTWNLDRENSLVDLIRRLNQIRKENPALQHDRGFQVHETNNEKVIVFSKKRGSNVILVAVNTDPYNTQWAHINLDLAALGIAGDQPFQVHDLLTNDRYQWQGNWNVVGLDPGSNPAHVFAVRRKARSEQDFDYFV
jgi:starch synthase (maltosyl-transferring)